MDPPPFTSLAGIIRHRSQSVQKYIQFPLPWREGMKGRGSIKWLKFHISYHPHLYPVESLLRRVRRSGIQQGEPSPVEGEGIMLAGSWEIGRVQNSLCFLAQFQFYCHLNMIRKFCTNS
jgi:hypothetical protein